MTTITRRIVKPVATSSNSDGGTYYGDSASSQILSSVASERGNRVDDDDRDSDDDKETRLTLMEEVLLLGLKDREVCWLTATITSWYFQNLSFPTRATHPFGMIASHQDYVAVFWQN